MTTGVRNWGASKFFKGNGFRTLWRNFPHAYENWWCWRSLVFHIRSKPTISLYRFQEHVHFANFNTMQIHFPRWTIVTPCVRNQGRDKFFRANDFGQARKKTSRVPMCVRILYPTHQSLKHCSPNRSRHFWPGVSKDFSNKIKFYHVKVPAGQ